MKTWRVVQEVYGKRKTVAKDISRDEANAIVKSWSKMDATIGRKNVRYQILGTVKNPRVKKKRARNKNPRMAVLLAQRPGGPILKYLGGIKFSERGRGVLFHSAKSALAMGRSLKAHFPALTHYKLFAR